MDMSDPIPDDDMPWCESCDRSFQLHCDLHTCSCGSVVCNQCTIEDENGEWCELCMSGPNE